MLMDQGKRPLCIRVKNSPAAMAEIFSRGGDKIIFACDNG